MQRPGLELIHYFGIGKHSISPEDREVIESRLPYEYIAKCTSPKCKNSYLRLIKEYDDTYYVQDMGQKRVKVMHSELE